jgi:hypothetical protein
MYLSQQIKGLSPQDPSADIQPVFIPYGGILGAILKWDRDTDNRINKRVFTFLRMIALSRALLRYKLHYGHEKLVIADLTEDLHEVLHIPRTLQGFHWISSKSTRTYSCSIPVKDKTKCK